MVKKEKGNASNKCNKFEEHANSIDEGLTYEVEDECTISNCTLDNIIKSSL